MSLLEPLAPVRVLMPLWGERRDLVAAPAQNGRRSFEPDQAGAADDDESFMVFTLL